MSPEEPSKRPARVTPRSPQNRGSFDIITPRRRPPISPMPPAPLNKARYDTPVLSVAPKPIPIAISDEELPSSSAIPDKPSVVAPPVAPLDFTPPPKPTKRKLPKLHKPDTRVSYFVKQIIAGIAILMLLTGIIYWRTHQTSNGDVTLRQALEMSLSTRQLHSETTGAGTDIKVDYDFSTSTNPIISSTATVSLAGLPAQVAGYGDVKNTYISYKQLPASAPPAISSSVTGNWVSLRSNGEPALGAPSQLARVADPRYQAFGPVLFGNAQPLLKKQLLDYMFSHIIYDYTGNKPTTTSIDGIKVTKFDTKLNTGFLKVANQSLAAATGLSPTDIQDAIAGIDSSKGAEVHLYVSAKSHRIVRMEIVKNNQTVTTNYSGSNSAHVQAEPQTKLTWKSFAGTQFQLASQIAAKQPAVTLDVQRKKQLSEIHTTFRDYFNQTGSYPSLSNINDPSWVATNLAGLDPDTLRDPVGTSQAVLGAPKPASFAYQVANGTGKDACINTAENPCLHYYFVTVLSNNQQYPVQDP